MEQIYKLPLVLEPQPEGGYTITCPLIPGLITEADTLDQVQPHVTDALSALIEGYQALGKAMPPALRALAAQADTPLWTEALIAVNAVGSGPSAGCSLSAELGAVA